MDREGKTKFEKEVCLIVTNFRKEKGLSQYDLSLVLDVSRSFIAQAESPNNSATYNINHLNRLSHEFDCPISTFFPDNPIIEDNWD